MEATLDLRWVTPYRCLLLRWPRPTGVTGRAHLQTSLQVSDGAPGRLQRSLPWAEVSRAAGLSSCPWTAPDASLSLVFGRKGGSWTRCSPRTSGCQHCLASAPVPGLGHSSLSPHPLLPPSLVWPSPGCTVPNVCRASLQRLSGKGAGHRLSLASKDTREPRCPGLLRPTGPQTWGQTHEGPRQASACGRLR